MTVGYLEKQALATPFDGMTSCVEENAVVGAHMTGNKA